MQRRFRDAGNADRTQRDRQSSDADDHRDDDIHRNYDGDRYSTGTARAAVSGDLRSG
ncbi:MAG: hypothetical protein HOH95_05270 [Dehalococcoidia bacterium]|nr:hypothetical protein [Dehalococcoidia bacterium]